MRVLSGGEDIPQRFTPNQASAFNALDAGTAAGRPFAMNAACLKRSSLTGSHPGAPKSTANRVA